MIQDIVRRLLRLEKSVEETRRLVVQDPLNAGKAKTTPIVSGAIEVIKPWVLVTPESGTADDLDSISGGADGKLVVVAPANDGDTITVRPYTLSGGNIDLRGSGNGRVLGDRHDNIFLIYRGDTGHWEQVGPDTLNSLIGVALDNPPADGDVLVYDADSGNWVNAAGSGVGAVSSVNGQTGAVVLDSDDIAEGATNLYMSVAEAAKLATFAGKYAETITVDATTKMVTHNLNTTDVIVMVYEVTSKDVIYPDIDITGVNTVTILYDTASGASHRVVVIG